MRDEFQSSVQNLGKPRWQSFLNQVISLHEDSIHAPCYGLPYRWEETSPSRELGIHFGHWDSVHVALDALAIGSKHGIQQILNTLSLQDGNGMIPGHLGIVDYKMKWTTKSTFPPLWPMAIHNYLTQCANEELIQYCYRCLVKQIEWFEKERRGEDDGFYYLDYLDRIWESGVEGGVRYDISPDDTIDTLACIDATSHVYSLYRHASMWADLIGEEPEKWVTKGLDLKSFIENELFNEQKGYFFDQWVVENPEKEIITFEGMWPIFVGAASNEQAQRVINEYLLSHKHFFTPHPIPTLSLSSPHYSNVSWRGPTYNSMTYWAAQGCIHYHRLDAAKHLLERALDATAEKFEQTGFIWECYDPTKGNPKEITRHPLDYPSKNHLGHNPLIAMAKLYDEIP